MKKFLLTMALAVNEYFLYCNRMISYINNTH